LAEGSLATGTEEVRRIGHPVMILEPMPDHDARLLSQFQQGDVCAFDALVARHGRTVYSFVRRFLGSTSAADDVYQEVWLKVIRGADRFRARSRFTTWLFQITRNACMDHLRQQARRRDGLPLEPDPEREPVDTSPSAAATAERRELEAALGAAIAELPAEQREVFLLRGTTSLTFVEIAALTGTSPNTVKSRMRYALERVREGLRKSTARPRAATKATNTRERETSHGSDGLYG
jgi:RNA polymerase sigma-70 factor (ECF subfamily)